MERGKKNARQKSCAVSFCLGKGAKVPWSISFWSEASPRQYCPVFSVVGGEGKGRDIGRSAVHLAEILGQPYSISPLPFLLPVNGSC